VAYKLLNAPPALMRAYQAAYVPPMASAGIEAECPDRVYEKLTNIQPIPVTNGEFTMYSTPDSAFFVTRRLLESAQRSILIGIYDFTAFHMRDLLLAAVDNGVEVSLMLDCNFSNNPATTSAEKSIFNELQARGVRCVRAPSCQGGTRRFFRVAHEKVIVVDDVWTLVQSGNYTNNSIPFNQSNGVNTPNFRTGNRDMGIAIKSTAVATFFSELIRRDMRLELGEVEDGESTLLATSLPPLFERVTESVDFELFPSDTFTEADTVNVLPVLTPDNYLNVIPDFIASATRSIVIEQQYIRNINFASNGSIRRLVEAIRSARAAHPDLRVRIIVAPPYNANSDADRNQLQAELDALASAGFLEGQHVRLLNKNHLTHCHNKLVIVDDEKVLISSQNWSEPAVTINREAGVLIEHPRIAGYFARIFDEDWNNAFQSIEDAPDTEVLVLEDPTPENIEAVLEDGEFRLVEWGDHADL